MSKKEILPEKRILAECVLFHRIRLEETQEIFAEGCDISVEMVSLIERQMTNPSFEVLVKISWHIEMSVSDMLKFEEKKRTGRYNLHM